VNIFEAERSKIKGLTSTVRLLDPATTLAKGWSLTRDSQGQLIRSTSQTKVGDVITTSFVDGFVHSEVKGVE
jgi:exodeoxyribonuclease VII large subunit